MDQEVILVLIKLYVIRLEKIENKRCNVYSFETCMTLSHNVKTHTMQHFALK